VTYEDGEVASATAVRAAPLRTTWRSTSCAAPRRAANGHVQRRTNEKTDRQKDARRDRDVAWGFGTVFVGM